MRNFLLMVQFMTRIPVPLHIDFTPARFVGGMKWMPLVGLFVGFPAAAIYFCTAGILGAEIGSFLALVVLITVTGGLHLDGMGDTADGIFSYRPRDRVLEIMRDSTLGTNGVIAIILTILFKLLLLKSLAPAACLPALLSGPILGRMTVPWHAALVHYARDGKGMGDFTNQVGIRHAGSSMVVSFLLITGILLLSRAGFWFALGVSVLLHTLAASMAVAFAYYLRYRIGGITGDTFGASIELVEIMTFLTFLLIWDLRL